ENRTQVRFPTIQNQNIQRIDMQRFINLGSKQPSQIFRTSGIAAPLNELMQTAACVVLFTKKVPVDQVENVLAHSEHDDAGKRCSQQAEGARTGNQLRQ